MQEEQDRGKQLRENCRPGRSGDPEGIYEHPQPVKDYIENKSRDHYVHCLAGISVVPDSSKKSHSEYLGEGENQKYPAVDKG